MSDPEILTTFTGLLRDMLGDDTIVLTLSTKRSDIPNWDSFTYVTFIAAVEMQLGIRFRVAAVESFSTVGDIVVEASRLMVK